MIILFLRCETWCSLYRLFYPLYTWDLPVAIQKGKFHLLQAIPVFLPARQILFYFLGVCGNNAGLLAFGQLEMEIEDKLREAEPEESPLTAGMEGDEEYGE